MGKKELLTPVIKDLGGFSVRRLLPTSDRRTIGPWIFFDHMGPAHFDKGDGIDVRPHPHINLATVTYLFEGEIMHRDSLGTQAVIKPGDINLMVSGSGITHSEREPEAIRHRVRSLHGLQLWHALPEHDEEIAPAFYHYDQEELPGKAIEGGSVRVLMGEAYGLSSPVKTFAKTLYVELHLQAGASVELPTIEQQGVYLIKGDASVDDHALPLRHLFVLEDGGNTLHATESSHLVIVGGEPFSKRYLEWNFVSSRKERIERAKEDWREGRFPLVPGDDKEFIPLPGS